MKHRIIAVAIFLVAIFALLHHSAKPREAEAFGCSSCSWANGCCEFSWYGSPYCFAWRYVGEPTCFFCVQYGTCELGAPGVTGAPGATE